MYCLCLTCSHYSTSEVHIMMCTFIVYNVKKTIKYDLYDVLVGGSGRTSLARVANWLCDYKMFTIELTKTYGVPDFKEDLKRLYYETGVKDQQTSFLFNDTQIANEVFLEIINNVLSTGEVAKLYKEEEFEEVIIICFQFPDVANKIK